MPMKPDPATNAAAAATEPADRLELLFEARVARALDRLGVPRAEQIQELKLLLERLSDRVDALGAAVIAPRARAASPDEPANLVPPLVTRAATPRRSRRSPAAAAANPKPGS